MNNKDTYRRNRNTGVGAGILVLIFARLLSSILLLWVILWLVGLGFVLWGCWNWTKYKGRNRWWTLCGLLAPIGFIPLALMKDKYVEEKADYHQETSVN